MPGRGSEVLGAKKGPKPLASHETCKAEGEETPARRIEFGPAEDDVVGNLDDECQGSVKTSQVGSIQNRPL